MALFSRKHVAVLLAGLPPDALISILAYLNTFWSENLRRFTILLSLPFWDRLMIVMSDLAKRAGVRDSERIILLPEVGHQELSEMIGCSRPLVTRMIAEMVQSGLLARRKKQYVLLERWDSNHTVATRRSRIGGSSPGALFDFLRCGTLNSGPHWTAPRFPRRISRVRPLFRPLGGSWALSTANSIGVKAPRLVCGCG